MTDWQPPSELPDLRNTGLTALDLETNDERLRADKGSGWPTGELLATPSAPPGKIANNLIGAAKDDPMGIPAALKRTPPTDRFGRPGQSQLWRKRSFSVTAEGSS
jgi:hypothetical protein